MFIKQGLVDNDMKNEPAGAMMKDKGEKKTSECHLFEEYWLEGVVCQQAP